MFLNRLANRMLGSPLLWGIALAAVANITLMNVSDKLPGGWANYVSGRWESYACTTLFVVAITLLASRVVQLLVGALALQRFAARFTGESEPLAVTKETLFAPFKGASWLKNSIVYRRLLGAWSLIQRRPTAQVLSVQLQDLSAVDHEELHHRYGMVRLMIWSIASCGCLAAILAIAKSVQLLEPNQASADVVTSGTAALSEALTMLAFFAGLALVLAVAKFVVEHLDLQLLTAVDRQVCLSMAGHQDSPDESSAVRQLEQLTETLKSIAGGLTQQPAQPRRAGVIAAGTATDSLGFTASDMERAIQRAFTSALQSNGGRMGDSHDAISMDASGGRSLQQVLQRLAAVLELQSAKLDSEGRVTKHLSAILDAGLNESQPPLRDKPDPRHREDATVTLGR